MLERIDISERTKQAAISTELPGQLGRKGIMMRAQRDIKEMNVLRAYCVSGT